MTIIAKFYPNGEFTHGVDTRRGRKERKPKERRYEPLDQECRDRYLQWRHANAEIDLCVPGQSYLDREGKKLWVYTGTDKWGNHLYDAINSEGADTYNIQMNYPIGRLIGSGSLTPLVHQMVESSPQPQKSSRKRLMGMTKNMARNIRNGVYLLEQWYGKDNLSFLTLTLPDLSNDDLAKCCQKWDSMIDQLLKGLRKVFKKHNMEFTYVYCTEIQSKRLQRRGEYAPHFHCVFRGRYARKKSWVVTPKKVRSLWSAIVANCVDHTSFDNSACENIQRIRYSAARYLSKYMSKGNCSIAVGSETVTGQHLHTQWGGMARKVSRGIRAATTRISGSNSNQKLFLGILESMEVLILSGFIRYYRSGFIPTSTCPHTGVEYGIKVGTGCLRTPTYQGGLADIQEFLSGIGVV